MSSQRVLKRAAAYVGRCPISQQGQNGSVSLYRVCCALTHGFCVDADEAMELLAEWNERCEPPWSWPELDHAVTRSIEAIDHDKPFGHLLESKRKRRR